MRLQGEPAADAEGGAIADDGVFVDGDELAVGEMMLVAAQLGDGIGAVATAPGIYPGGQRQDRRHVLRRRIAHTRSEERRVGEACFSPCRFRLSTSNSITKNVVTL